MTPQRTYLDHIQDIHDAISRVAEFIAGQDYGQFEKDAKTTYAVVRALEILGEAAKAIPDPVRRRYPSVPWRQMVGMRDKLIHQYFGVNLEVVWKTATEDLPDLVPLITQILREADQQDAVDAGGHGADDDGAA